MGLTDLEKIEDKYPELKFYKIDVPDLRYHGHIEGTDVYINERQSNVDWLVTALHEVAHYDFNNCDLSDRTSFKTKVAESWAISESKREYKAMFGKETGRDDRFKN